ncbi:MAG: outer membrane lipoprotein-sorting protein [Gemmatimonadota bacterium]|nr:MAG: outer membrane lipoprotein-sorting protein [Gemmatimonadota bacterium]
MGLWIKRAAAALALTTPLAPGTAQAQDGSTLLARVDSVLTAPRDQSAVERMTLIDRDGSTKERELRFYQKGSEKRLVRFVKPADVRGVAFLRLADDRMYLYLPAFRRVRRIASSIKNEGFMGTDFSYEDLSQTSYSEDYEVTAVSKGPGSYALTLERRDGADVSYARLVMEFGEADWVVRKIDYFDESGERIKTFTATEVRQIDGYAYVTRMEMVTWKSGHRTVLELEELRLDSGLSDDLFTQRSLKRPV